MHENCDGKTKLYDMRSQQVAIYIAIKKLIEIWNFSC